MSKKNCSDEYYLNELRKTQKEIKKLKKQEELPKNTCRYRGTTHEILGYIEKIMLEFCSPLVPSQYLEDRTCSADFWRSFANYFNSLANYCDSVLEKKDELKQLENKEKELKKELGIK